MHGQEHNQRQKNGDKDALAMNKSRNSVITETEQRAIHRQDDHQMEQGNREPGLAEQRDMDQTKNTGRQKAHQCGKDRMGRNYGSHAKYIRQNSCQKHIGFNPIG